MASFAAQPRPVSSRSASPKQKLIRSGDAGASSAALACRSTGDAPGESSLPPGVKPQSDAPSEEWRDAPGGSSLPPGVKPRSGAPSEEWQEAMASLQRDYAEALRRIDVRINARMSVLKAELEKSRDYELPPSYPPSDLDSFGATSGAGRPLSDPETIETDPDCT